MASWARSRIGVSAVLALVLFVLACDTGPSHRQTRAGTAIALETRHTAMVLARALAERPDPACGVWTPTTPMAAEVTWSVEGYRAGEPALELNETRRLTVDAQGAVSLVRDADFRTPAERSGQRDREWRLVGGHVYTRDLNLPFERREAHSADAEALRDAVPEVFETLVRATGGAWHTRATEDGFELETASRPEPPTHVRCGREGVLDPWLDDLLGGARLLEGRARVRHDASGRLVERSGGWTFELLDTEAPLTLEAAVMERVQWDTEVAEITPPTEVFDTTRPRPYAQLQAFLRAVDAVVARSESGTGTGTGDGTGNEAASLRR